MAKSQKHINMPTSDFFTLLSFLPFSASDYVGRRVGLASRHVHTNHVFHPFETDNILSSVFGSKKKAKMCPAVLKSFGASSAIHRRVQCVARPIQGLTKINTHVRFYSLAFDHACQID